MRGLLTVRQRDLLDFLKTYIEREGVAPSFDEMQAGLGLASKSGVHRLVDALVERGCIKRIKNRARAIEIIENPTLHVALDLRRYTNQTLAIEAQRRGLVLGEIFEDFAATSNAVVRRFREIRA